MSVFLNRHRELRSGWRIFGFLLLWSALTFVFAGPFILLDLTSDVLFRLALLASLVLATYGFTRFVNKKPFGSIGLSLHPLMFRELGIGCLIGFLMMTGIFVVQLMLGWVDISWRGLSVVGAAQAIGWSLLVFAIAAFFEEFLFRGYVFQTLIQWITFLPATTLMACLFALAHSQNPNVTTFALVNVGLANVWLSIAYMRTRSLYLPFGLHFTWNFSQTSLYGFPTSGGSFQDQRVFDLVQQGPDWITGATFGPEGGALATLALVAGTWYVLKSRFVVVPEGIVTLDSLEDVLLRRPEAEAGT
jgi:membrane protease YdiL (CAAX protease family)